MQTQKYKKIEFIKKKTNVLDNKNQTTSKGHFGSSPLTTKTIISIAKK